MSSTIAHAVPDALATHVPDEAPPAYQKPPKHSKWGMLWDTFDAPKEERKLLFKLDLVLLSFMSMGYFTKNLDQANVSSAFVSGMKEDLHMNGNQLTTATTLFTIGYVLGQIPSNMILTRVAPRYWIPALEIGWGICTLASYKAKTYQQLYAIRFFVGLFESGFYPAAQYLLGSFFKPGELGKRAVFFHCMGAVGQMLSSELSAGTYANLSGVQGIEGWRWLFIVDAIITLPVAVAGLLFLPSLPGQASYKPSWWLTQADLDLIDKRMRSVGRAPMGPLTVKKVGGYFKKWHIWLLPPLYVIWNNSANASSIISLWLKSQSPAHYSTVQVNHYTMPVHATQAVCGLIAGWASDGPLRGRRWPPIVLFTLGYAATCIALLVLPVYEYIPAHFVLYYLVGGTGGLSGLYFAWANEICADDNEERALVVVLMNDLAYVVQAIVPNFVWKTVDYPKSTAGLSYSVALSLLITPLSLTIRYLHQRDARKAAGLARDRAFVEEEEEKSEGEAGQATPLSLDEKKEGGGEDENADVVAHTERAYPK